MNCSVLSRIRTVGSLWGAFCMKTHDKVYPIPTLLSTVQLWGAPGHQVVAEGETDTLTAIKAKLPSPTDFILWTFLLGAN